MAIKEEMSLLNIKLNVNFAWCKGRKKELLKAYKQLDKERQYHAHNVRKAHDYLEENKRTVAIDRQRLMHG